MPEVYSASEIARAAGVDTHDVVEWARVHDVEPRPGGFYTTPQAVLMVRQLIGHAPAENHRHDLFERSAGARRRPGLPVAIAASLHLGFLAVLALFTTASLPAHRGDSESPMTTQLVFLATPGPGGGGGGGGRKEAALASPAERKGHSRLRSPVAAQPEVPTVTVPERPEPKPETPPVIAPVAPISADAQNTVGVPVEAPPKPETHGPGTEGGAGSGTGTGVLSGTGPGIGPGSGGGTGGGPYRGGSGITPPSLLREVKPDYTEEGRRRGIEGEVELEIVIRHDGSVGDVRLLHGLGSGLDERAIDAVRQWRFSPATRQGAPVDVFVQVSVEFRLR
jgi:protein TonB